MSQSTEKKTRKYGQMLRNIKPTKTVSRIENLNRPIRSKKLESIIKKTTNKQTKIAQRTPGVDDFLSEFYQTFKEESMSVFFKLLKKNNQRENPP